jgi:CRISPR-associated endonuclease/helicase Cas3
MLSYFELISHPDRTLKTHLDSCNGLSQKMLAMKFIANAFYDKSLLERMRHILVYFHDFGKATDFFQLKIIEATEKNTENADFKTEMAAYRSHFNHVVKKKLQAELRNHGNKQDVLGHHAKLGAYMALSGFKSEDIILELIVLKIIRRHHGFLTNFIENMNRSPQILLGASDLEIMDIQISKTAFDAYQPILTPQQLTISAEDWVSIRKRFRRFNEATVRNQLRVKRDIRYFFLQHFLFSLLLSADKGDMMLKDADKLRFIQPKRQLPLDLVDAYKAYKFNAETRKPIDIQRETAYQHIAKNADKYADKSFFSITLPTGLGKTFAAYNAAILLQKKVAGQTGVMPRIVYALPFTSIIDQNCAIFEDILKFHPDTDTHWLTKNHYLSPYKDSYPEQELLADEKEYVAEGWEHEVIVTTFVQFLEGIFTNQNRALRKFHNMTNAIFILDEVQAIPTKYYPAIELVMKSMATFFNTKFVFVTATQPVFFKEPAEILELTDPTFELTRQYFTDLNRIEIDQSLLKARDYKPIEMNDFMDILIQDIENQRDKSFLIIVNTIAQSQTVYKKLAARFGDKNLLYLSSSILPMQRLAVIDTIKKAKICPIVVSTQVVEAGVDIDMDVVYRDFAPIDSINQSAGRCNRNQVKAAGPVKLYHLGRCGRIYDPILMNITQAVLQKYPDKIAERDLFQLNSEYAHSVRKKSTEKRNDSQELIEAMYALQLEDIAEKFKLIPEEYRHYDVFVPCDETAVALWQQYLETVKIENPFEKKRKVKALKPQLLQYVTRFPKNKYDPPKTQFDKWVIYESNWDVYYDLKTGFKADSSHDFI